MDKIIAILSQFNSARNWNKFHSIKNLSMALSVEVSELMELFKWKSENDIKNEILKNQNYLSAINKEISDVFIYLLILCNKLGLDEQMIKDNIFSKIEINRVKYPIEN